MVGWGPPEDANGVVSSYTLILSREGSPDDTVELDSTAISYEFQNLTPYTDYTVVAFVSTLHGPGENARLSFTTEIGSMWSAL